MKYVLASAGFDLGFGVFHMFFWRLFRWQEELARLGFINRAIVQILNLRMTYTFVLMAALLLWVAITGERSTLAVALLAGMALFWAMRAIEQLWFFGSRQVYSNLMTATFACGAVLHGVAAVALAK